MFSFDYFRLLHFLRYFRLHATGGAICRFHFHSFTDARCWLIFRHIASFSYSIVYGYYFDIDFAISHYAYRFRVCSISFAASPWCLLYASAFFFRFRFSPPIFRRCFHALSLSVSLAGWYAAIASLQAAAISYLRYWRPCFQLLLHTFQFHFHCQLVLQLLIFVFTPWFIAITFLAISGYWPQVFTLSLLVFSQIFVYWFSSLRLFFFSRRFSASWSFLHCFFIFASSSSLLAVSFHAKFSFHYASISFVLRLHYFQPAIGQLFFLLLFYFASAPVGHVYQYFRRLRIASFRYSLALSAASAFLRWSYAFRCCWLRLMLLLSGFRFRCRYVSILPLRQAAAGSFRAISQLLSLADASCQACASKRSFRHFRRFLLKPPPEFRRPPPPPAGLIFSFCSPRFSLRQRQFRRRCWSFLLRFFAGFIAASDAAIAFFSFSSSSSIAYFYCIAAIFRSFSHFQLLSSSGFRRRHFLVCQPASHICHFLRALPFRYYFSKAFSPAILAIALLPIFSLIFHYGHYLLPHTYDYASDIIFIFISPFFFGFSHFHVFSFRFHY